MDGAELGVLLGLGLSFATSLDEQGRRRKREQEEAERRHVSATRPVVIPGPRRLLSYEEMRRGCRLLPY